MNSYQTTVARGMAEAAADTWAEHKRACPSCSRTRGPLCAAGTRLKAQRDGTAETYRQEKARDGQPNPEQGTLWP